MKNLIKSALVTLVLLTSTLVFAASHKVMLVVLPGCEYCTKAESILDHSGVKYTTSVSRGGTVPRLYVDGKYKGTGVDAVQSWVSKNYSR